MAKVKLIALRTLPSDQGEILPGHAFSVELKEAPYYIRSKDATYASEFRESMIKESKVKLEDAPTSSNSSKRKSRKSSGSKKTSEDTRS